MNTSSYANKFAYLHWPVRSMLLPLLSPLLSVGFGVARMRTLLDYYIVHEFSFTNSNRHNRINIKPPPSETENDRHCECECVSIWL